MATLAAPHPAPGGLDHSGADKPPPTVSSCHPFSDFSEAKLTLTCLETMLGNPYLMFGVDRPCTYNMLIGNKRSPDSPQSALCLVGGPHKIKINVVFPLVSL